MHNATILTEGEGNEILKISRELLENFVRHEHFSRPKSYPDIFNRNYGIVCTVTKGGDVRGTGFSGLPHPLLSIMDATMHSVISASHDIIEDPIESDELNDIKIELSILTELQLVQLKASGDMFENIVPGTDGVMIRYGLYESFLLPQEWSNVKDKEEFLSKLCIKAGLTKDMWKDPRIEIYKFQVQVFRED